MHAYKKIQNIIFITFLFLSIPMFSSAEEIDTVQKWAWGDEMGWVNFNPDFGDVRVFDTGLRGSFWTENAGWILLNPTLSGVLNNEGSLSGNAWGANTGWVDFSGVSIDPATGVFSGTATTEEIGSITFSGDLLSVVTSWRGSSYGINGTHSDNRFRGYAWSDGIGWISMNCSNTTSCDVVEYGVDADSEGNLTGMAWSDYAGWLDFSYYNNAVLNLDTGVMSGDIQFLSALAEDDEWTGRVSLSGSSPQYGVVLDFDSYEFDGFAWGANVLGWIDFQTPFSVVTMEPFKFSFTANKGLSAGNEVPYGGSVVLSWTTSGAASCTASDGGNTDWADTPLKPAGEPTSGTHAISTIFSDTQFFLTCRDSSGRELVRNLTVFVNPAAPIVTITASDTNVSYGATTDLIWTADNVSECAASGDWSGQKAVGAGTETTTGLTNPVYVYYLDCLSDFIVDYPDPVTDSIQVDVEKLILDLYPEQNPVPYGDAITIFWNVEFATSCSAVSDLPGFPTVLDSSEGEHSFEVNQVEEEEGRVYSLTVSCDGMHSQTVEESLSLRVGKNPVYREN